MNNKNLNVYTPFSIELTSDTGTSIAGSIGRQVIANITPAYASLLLFGFIIAGIPPDSPQIPTYFFAATIAAIGMSAIQPYVIRFSIRPSDLVAKMADASAKHELESIPLRDRKKIGMRTKEKTQEELTKRYKRKIDHLINREFDEFELSKMNMSSGERERFAYSEARLLAFFYLAIIFGVTLVIGLSDLASAVLPVLPRWVSMEPVAVVIISLIGFLVFFIGYRKEKFVYRNAAWSHIPIMAAGIRDQSIDLLQEDLRYVENEKKNKKDAVSKKVLSEWKKEIETEYKEAYKFALAKNRFENRVAKEVGWVPEKIREIALEFSEDVLRIYPIDWFVVGFVLILFMTPSSILVIYLTPLSFVNYLPVLSMVGIFFIFLFSGILQKITDENSLWISLSLGASFVQTLDLFFAHDAFDSTLAQLQLTWFEEIEAFAPINIILLIEIFLISFYLYVSITLLFAVFNEEIKINERLRRRFG